MQILVNKTPFDVQLEHEKSAGDVFRGLSLWFSEHALSVTSLEINGSPVEISEIDTWGDRSIEEVSTLDLSVSSRYDQRRDHLMVLLDYVTMFRQAAASGNMEVVAQLIAEYSPVRRSLDTLINPGEGRHLLGEQFDQLLDQTGVLRGEPGPGLRTLLGFLKNLEILITDRLEELIDPPQELLKVVSALEELVPVLEELPVLLQTGKDNEAMQHIVTFTELAGKLTRLFSYIGIDASSDLVSSYRELNPILSELTEAFDSADAVLIGDLVEYEIAPRITTLCNLARDTLATLREPGGER